MEREIRRPSAPRKFPPRLVLGYFLNKEKYQDVEVSETVNWFAVLGVVLGAVVANLVHWGIASINGMVVAAVCYLIGRAVEKK